MTNLLAIAENGLRAEQELRSLPGNTEPIHRAVLAKMAHQGRLAREATLSRPASEGYLDPRAQNLRDIQREEDDRRIRGGLENGTHVIPKYAQEGIAANDYAMSVVNDPSREGGKLTPEEADAVRAKLLASNTGLRRTATMPNPEDYPNRPGADVARAYGVMPPDKRKLLDGLLTRNDKGEVKAIDGIAPLLALAPEEAPTKTDTKIEKTAAESPEEKQAKLEAFDFKRRAGKVMPVEIGSEEYLLLNPNNKFRDPETGRIRRRGDKDLDGETGIIEQDRPDGSRVNWIWNGRTGQFVQHSESRGTTAQERAQARELGNQEWRKRFELTTERSLKLHEDTQKFQSEQAEKREKALRERQAIADKESRERYDNSLKIGWQKTVADWNIKREKLFNNQKEQLTAKANGGIWTLPGKHWGTRMPTPAEIDAEAKRQVDEQYPPNAYGNSYKEYYRIPEKKTGVKQGQQPAPAQVPAPASEQPPAGEPTAGAAPDAASQGQPAAPQDDSSLPHPKTPQEAATLHGTYFITPDGRKKWAP